MKKLFQIITLIIVFFFFYHTLFYELKLFDEITVFKEYYLPVCTSFSEMFELISRIGLKQHAESMNTLYSNIYSLRCNPFGNFLQLFIQIIFQKKLLYYHLYSFILHLINTLIVFYLLDKVSLYFFKNTNNNAKLRLMTNLGLTLLWSLHPVNLESILLASNANIVLSYTLSLLATLIYLNFFSSDFKHSKITKTKSILLFFVYLIALFTAEFHFMLPLILLMYVLAMKFHLSKDFLSSIKFAFKPAIPLFLASFIFIMLFLSSSTRVNLHMPAENPNDLLSIVLERIFWLSPQILVHFIKLILFPLKLTIDQSHLVELGKTLFHPYALSCIIFIFFITIFSLLSLKNSKKSPPFIFITIFLLLISLFPFSHIAAPLYNLASERYLYFPSFILIFGVSHFIYCLLSKIKEDKILSIVFITLLASITICYSTRSYIRTLDWKSNFTLYQSSIHATNNSLYKAFRYKGLPPENKLLSRYPEHSVDPKYTKLAMKNLKVAIKTLKQKKEKYQDQTPLVIKSYGLDPETLLAKAGYFLSQTDFIMNRDYKRALDLIQPYTEHITVLDNASASFYSGILFYNNRLEDAEKVLRALLTKFPHSPRIIFPLCDLIYIQNRDLNEIENLALHLFKYYPYDSFTLFSLVKIYREKRDLKNYAHFVYLLGLRRHSIPDLKNAQQAYQMLGNKEMSEKATKWINNLQK